MVFDEAQRSQLVSRYAGLYRQALYGEDEAGAAAELTACGQEYEAALPQVPFARCPISGEVQVHSFDPFGLDGPWWNYDAPLRPLMERLPTCRAVTGAVALAGDLPDVPWLCRPGPGLPFVLPRLLAAEGVFATIRQLNVGAHTAWAVCYFAAEAPAGLAMPNAWGTGTYWDASDGAPGWSSNPTDPAERDFSLSPWIARGKLFWIAPGDDTLTLRTEVAGCPFIGLPGEKREQRIAFGRLRLDDELPPEPQRLTGSETIGDFALFELEDGLRDDLRLPPVPVPVRVSHRDIVFPPGHPVDLDAMLAEVEAFLAVNPGLAPGYAPLLAALGLTAGMVEAERGSHLRALACYGAGLRAAPDSVALRSHEALALYALDRGEEARERLEALVETVPRGQVLPLVWMLLARIYVAEGVPDKARPLVDELAALGGQDAAVAGFRALLDGGAAPQAAPAQPNLVEEPPAPPPAHRRSLLLPALLAVALGIGGLAVWRTFGQREAVSPTAQPSAAPSTDAAPAAPSAAPVPSIDPLAEQQRRDIVGIWAPEEGGCGMGFGFAFTPAGRYGEGDEYMGEEGRWEITGGKLIETVDRAYEAEDEVSARKVKTIAKRYEYELAELTAPRMVLVNGEARMAFVKCPDGRRAFTDGETFP